MRVSARSKGTGAPRSRSLADVATGSGFRLSVAIIFLVMICLLGGGSRSDIASLILLRPLAVLFAAYALWAMPEASRATIKAPMAWLLLLAVWMVVQLIPLPADLWSSLPGRDSIYQIDRMLGQPDISRPISLMPSMTWNSLMSLVVPMAALLVFAAVDEEDRSMLFAALIWLGVASALLGLMQLWANKADLLYFYRITNRDNMVGLFANRNHHAIFLSCALVLAGLAMRGALQERLKRPFLIVGLSMASLLLLVVLLAVGSRAGLAAGAIALAIWVTLVWPEVARARSNASHGRAEGVLKTPTSRFLVFVLLPVIALSSLVMLFFASDQNNAINRSLASSYTTELRGQTLATVLDLMQANWLLGTGFGSFAGVYRMVEPDSLLQPEYFNHAHNDWVQLVIEGGLPMLVLVLLALAWIGRNLFASWISYRTDPQAGAGFPASALAIGTICVILALASAGDYPIRTPSLTALLALMVVLLARSRNASTIVRGRP